MGRGDPQPADHTPSGQRGSRLRRCTPCPLAALRSWRLPGLLFLYGTLDDHDRLETRRSSSAGKCSSRRAAAPRSSHGGVALRHPSNGPPPPGAPRLLIRTCGAQTPFLSERRSAPSGGGQSVAIGPAGGIGKYPSGLCMGSMVPSITEQTWR